MNLLQLELPADETQRGAHHLQHDQLEAQLPPGDKVLACLEDPRGHHNAQHRRALRRRLGLVFLRIGAVLRLLLLLLLLVPGEERQVPIEVALELCSI